MFRNVLFLVLVFTTTDLDAQELEIGGLLLDNTISRQGREFYRQFSILWQDLPNSEGINVQIKEQVIPRSGTKLMVMMNHKLVYVTYMGRRQQPIKQRVETAMFNLIDVMAKSRFNQDNPDMVGSGW